jgi:hypothetical protein
MITSAGEDNVILSALSGNENETLNNNEEEMMVSLSSPIVSSPSSLSSCQVHQVPKNLVIKSILKRQSGYPKTLSVDDWPPVRIAEKGKMRHFTKDKYGRTIPYLLSFWFMEERYKEKARRALAAHLRLLEQKKKKIVELLRMRGQIVDDDTRRMCAAAMTLLTTASAMASADHTDL